MPAPKLRPVPPSTTTRPPVMYSQPWSPPPRAEHGAHRSFDVADRQLEGHVLASLQRRFTERQQLHVERPVEAVILLGDTEHRRALGDLGHVQDGREVEATGLPVVDGFA